MERISEAIRVAVVFGPGRKVKPVWFDWRNRKHTITETTYTWTSMDGESTLLHFSVCVDESLFELVYNTAGQSWTLLNLQP